MEYYRFRLQKYTPGSKISCPSCGRKRCAVKYIDTQGEISFPDEVCLCDHVNSCGYHYPPKEYFRDNPDVLKDLMEKENGTDNKGYLSNRHIKDTCSLAHAPPLKNTDGSESDSTAVSFIESDLVAKSMGAYHLNPLFRFLSGKFGHEETERIFRLYNVGTSHQWNGAMVYWYKDAAGNYRTGKVMGYDPDTGHRIKEPYNQVTWAHSLLKLPEFNMRLCLFGEHLLAVHTNKKVALVESEKTCLIASHFLSDYIWLATGGMKMGFKAEVMEALRGRDVTLFPDLGGYDEWSKHLPLMNSICRQVAISHYLEDIATDNQRAQGLDISDFLLQEEAKHEILNRMIQRNPALQLLIDKLNLELIED